MNSGRESLAAQIATDLRAIDGTGVYTNTVRTVSRDLATPSQLKTFPSIVMVEEGETEERTATKQRLFLLARFTLVLYIQTSPGTESATAVNSLIADVKHAMLGTSTNRHGNWCVRTIYAGMDPLSFESGKMAGAVLNFECLYSHTWDTP